MYCPNCYILLDIERCPKCGTKKVRAPYDDDFCFLTEIEGVWADPFTDILSQNDIPCFTRDANGAWMTARLGVAFERTRFYVPYSKIDDAHALSDEFFSRENAEE